MSMMMQVVQAVLAVALVLGASVCRANENPQDPALQEKHKLFQRFQPNLAQSLPERAQAIPDDFLESIIAFDKSIGIRNTDYKAHPLSSEEAAMFAEYVTLLPARHQATFSNKLLAVYFVDNFAGAGLTDWLVDENSEFHYYMILNSALLTESLDDWLSYRENSFFAAGSPFSIKVHTGTSYKALLYGLLHEGGHIVDIEYHVTPYIDPLHKKVLKQEGEVSDFTRGVWEQQKAPVTKYTFSNRDKLNVYGIFDRERIPAGEMEAMFLQLRETPFVSFYAGTAWYEDFADFITYHHIDRNLDGSIKVELYNEDKLIEKFKPTRRKLSGERKEIMKEFIKAARPIRIFRCAS